MPVAAAGPVGRNVDRTRRPDGSAGRRPALPPAWRVLLCLTLTTTCGAATHACPGQHTIVLRDLTLVPDVQVTGMSLDGLQLGDGRQLSWDQILQGTVDGQQQAEFDRWLAEIGLPLFRIRRRLASQDDGALQPFADQLVARCQNEGQASEALYLARCAQFRYLLFQGDREAALVPLLQMLNLRHNRPQLARLDAACHLRFDESGICENLLPVWFDSRAAAAVFAGLSDVPESSAGRVYYTTLSIAAGQPPGRDRQIATGPGDPWQSIHAAQTALLAGDFPAVLAAIDPDDHRPAASRHAIALYYTGLAASQLALSSDDATGDPAWMLGLLQIPARYENRFPELAAAAVYAVVHHPVNESDARFGELRGELDGRYQNTFFGKRHR